MIDTMSRCTCEFTYDRLQQTKQNEKKLVYDFFSSSNVGLNLLLTGHIY